VLEASAILEALDRVRSELDALRAAVVEMSANLRPSGNGLDSDADFLPDNMIDTVTAAERFHRPRDCMTRWAREGAGRKIGGRWLISVVRAQRRLNGE